MVTSSLLVEFFDPSVPGTATATAGDHHWPDGDTLAVAGRAEIDDDLELLETGRIHTGVVHDVQYSEPAATAWERNNCDRGGGRRFGGCAVDGGLVLQERAGDAVLLAVAFDLSVVVPDCHAGLTIVVEVDGH